MFRLRLSGLGSSVPRSLLAKPPLRPSACSKQYPLSILWRTFLSNTRHLNSKPAMKMSLPSSQRLVLNSQEAIKHDKWGFVIYRCTYADDQGWDRFKQLVHGRTWESMQSSDAPEVADSLEWTFVEDRSALDGASRSQLREHFKQWAAKAFVSEQPRAQDDTQSLESLMFGVPRYNYFVQVDDEALQSVLAAPKRDLSGKGFVNFVDSRWEPMDKEHYGPIEQGGELDAVDGCEQENVGWMKIASLMIDAGWYDAAFNFPGVGWYVYYLRPPGVVIY
jgi:hypothetical protein